MSLGTVSHLAFGVADLDRSLAFYRDVLGMKVRDDRTQRTGASAMYTASRAKGERRVANLTWEGSETFLVLSQFPDTTGDAIKLDQVGIHHVALWIDDVRGLYERLSAAGVTFVAEPIEFDAKGLRAGRRHDRDLPIGRPRWHHPAVRPAPPARPALKRSSRRSALASL